MKDKPDCEDKNTHYEIRENNLKLMCIETNSNKLTKYNEGGFVQQ